MEDIVTVFDGRPEIIEEVRRSESRLIDYLAECFSGLLKERTFLDALPGHLPSDRASQARVPFLIERIRAIAGLRQ